MVTVIATHLFFPSSGSFGNETAATLCRRVPAYAQRKEGRAVFSREPYITTIRRSDDINNIESEGRYRYTVSPCCTGNETNEHLLQEDTAATLRPLVISYPRVTNQNTQSYVHLAF